MLPILMGFFLFQKILLHADRLGPTTVSKIDADEGERDWHRV